MQYYISQSHPLTRRVNFSFLIAAATFAVGVGQGRGFAQAPQGANTPPAASTLQFHLMHPGGESLPGDPNAAFCIDGTYHLHYILQHPWKDRRSFSFVHVTSKDLLHWTWQSTKLQPAFTGHGMFSGTGFMTLEGQPAVIYHGESSGRNQIAIAKNRQLSEWEKPYPVDVRNPDGSPMDIQHWDPDCFVIDGTYYAISGGENPPLLKSKDLKTWSYVGPFLSHDLPDVAKGEDISCANFFKLGEKWVLLCISHDLGCRYYIGNWDKEKEQFIPEQHGRMNWRRENQSLFSRESWRADVFAPESVLTSDGRRVMWAWCATIDRNDGYMSNLTIQTLPRELTLDAKERLRIHPARELQSLRDEPKSQDDIKVEPAIRSLLANSNPVGKKLIDIDSDAMEIQLTLSKKELQGKLFGVSVYASDAADGAVNQGLPIFFRPETQTLRVGTAEAPFSVADLPEDEDIQLTIYLDRSMVEVFVSGRQAMVGWYPEYSQGKSIRAFSVGSPTTIKKLDSWKIRPTNQGFLEAQQKRIWEPKTQPSAD